MCRACADVIAVAAAFGADRDVTSSAPVPPATHVWWRANVRLRADADRTASRPIVWMQAATAAAVIGVALAYVPRLSGTSWVDPDVVSLLAPPLVIAGALMMLATPLAALAAFRRA